MDIEELNKRYGPLTPEQRIAELYKDFSKVLLTSSFGTTAACLLHLFNKVHPGEKVHFLDTTYHFPETLAYKKELTDLLHLNVVELKGAEWRNKFTRDDRTWEKDPDLCCSVNKVEPLESIKPDFEVWVSGLMSLQNEYRNPLRIFEQKNNIIKFFPIIDMAETQAYQYIKDNHLPFHPLKEKGYNSVGCVQCTSAGKAREGRWINKSKTECGLHL
jgi:phosphoadenosine phosphosulfate reductase